MSQSVESKDQNAASLIDGLLSKVDPILLQRYKLYLQFHVKLLLTHLSKYRIQQDTKPKIHFYDCKLKCYNNFKGDSFDVDKRQYLTSCVDLCEQPMRNLNQYLDDINFLSSKKLKECTSHCGKPPTGMDADCYKNLCLWECYNKLDRRYIKYWMEKRNKILKKHQINPSQS